VRLRAVGLMSGTSLDGIDAALVHLWPGGRGIVASLENFMTVPFSPDLACAIRAALPPHEPAPVVVAALDAALGDAFGAAVRAVSGDLAPDFVASHGLTLYHDGSARTTVQLGDPYRIRAAARATVVADFRRADCAAGGEGAPLVPYVDALLLGRDDRDVVALNLGGIANLTVVPRGARAPRLAFDAGPANMPLDGFVRARGAGDFDRDGALAARGTVDAAALRALLASEAAWFALPPPKSTGRERFGDGFLERNAAALAALTLADGCATLVAFVATVVRDAVAHVGVDPGASVVCSGGGARNPVLFAALRAELGGLGCEVVPSDACGLDGDAKEAVAFAILGLELVRGRPAGVPAATGAMYSALLGAIVPHELAALARKIEATFGANPA